MNQLISDILTYQIENFYYYKQTKIFKIKIIKKNTIFSHYIIMNLVYLRNLIRTTNCYLIFLIIQLILVISIVIYVNSIVYILFKSIISILLGIFRLWKSVTSNQNLKRYNLTY